VPTVTHATLAAGNGDGAQEAFVMYADGRVVRPDMPPAGDSDDRNDRQAGSEPVLTRVAYRAV
jgi:hypothetical protein